MSNLYKYYTVDVEIYNIEIIYYITFGKMQIDGMTEDLNAMGVKVYFYEHKSEGIL